ncbi:hypothetical protein K491DRAFT_261253 [Lophiostoma macrostomum CBS 122681]|uniref:Uncharacterized protein n=1 Tax=Lophiostoma macrostomum CBS 122681 TaxID=1314788 RepID=A0A6A6SKF3_9PLEO|nr:hypothetical protein K491DRAFT_261253 [Lophiostoma macrostomum CBS 122681]
MGKGLRVRLPCGHDSPGEASTLGRLRVVPRLPSAARAAFLDQLSYSHMLVGAGKARINPHRALVNSNVGDSLRLVAFYLRIYAGTSLVAFNATRTEYGTPVYMVSERSLQPHSQYQCHLAPRPSTAAHAEVNCATSPAIAFFVPLLPPLFFFCPSSDLPNHAAAALLEMKFRRYKNRRRCDHFPSSNHATESHATSRSKLRTHRLCGSVTCIRARNRCCASPIVQH